MIRTRTGRSLGCLLAAALLTAGTAGAGRAEVSSHTVTEFTSLPLNLDSVPPLVMISSSNDHQFYFKAYDDYTDLDGDGLAETTYQPAIVYYGYFDSRKCYDYDAADQRFEPRALAGESYSMQGTVTSFDQATGELTAQITILLGEAGLGPLNDWVVTNLETGATSGSSTHLVLGTGARTLTTEGGSWVEAGDQVLLTSSVPTYCDGANDGYWSGNFLNWLSMTRIDIIRKILFGGLRRVDTATGTVLERSYLPHDAHSWAKYYNGADLEKLTPFRAGTDYCRVLDSGNSACDEERELGITFANTTDVSNTNVFSQDVASPPLIKVARGNYSLWASNERWQCTWASGAPHDNHSAGNSNDPAESGIPAYASSPAYSRGIGHKNYVARVLACVDGLLGQEKCKQYPGADGSLNTQDDVAKPIGLFQVYGEEDQLLFGLMAGSYAGHAAGGILIENIRSLREEIEVDTDGTFKLVASSAGGPESDNQASGMINALSLWRIFGYSHSDGTYNSSQGDNCPWGLSSGVTGSNRCTNWGNPMGEIYLQGLRYLAAGGVAGVFRYNDSPFIDGLNTPQDWDTVLDEANSCARSNIINFNSGVISYDGDQLDGNSYGVETIWPAAILPGNKTAADLTDLVGAGESIHGQQYFIGETDVDSQSDGDDQLCTAKTVDSFGDAGGLCPDAPRLQGSYRIAGLAYYAHTEDIRDLGNTALPGIQKVDTYCVSATAAPEFAIPHPLTGARAVTLLPACRNTSLNPDGNCAIVDFKIVEQVVNNGSGIGSGRLYVNWEDSEQGGDYDQDMWGIIDYEINGSTNALTITTDVIAESTTYAMGFGYVLSGTTRDGFHAHSGIAGFTYDDTAIMAAGSMDCAEPGDTNHCQGGDGPTTAVYALGTGSAELLKDPLWYAAKWGGFQDSNDNKQPDLQEEWDVRDSDGNLIQDGIPDNYFYARNPLRLEKSLNRVFLTILRRTSSGTAAAVVSSHVRGDGALYQAYYEPLRQDMAGNQVKWIGTLQALWLDSHGYLREDDGDGALGGYNQDPVVETFFDEVENRTRVRRWTSSDPDRFLPETSVTAELQDLRPLWNTREQLAFSPGTDLAGQRAYGAPADTGRFIQSWIDADLDGRVDPGEVVPFTAAAVNGSRFGFFDLATEAEADGLVNYVRGVETAGYRNRTLDYDGDGQTEVMRLGDIVNSTPTVVGPPREAFDLLYQDNSYGPFRKRYARRRNVVYVGGNDGMLHALNGGFYNQAAQRFETAGTQPDGLTEATAHPLGAEMWAYVPMNLLPHLKWLKDEEYTHVFYVDGKPRVFDAKIFEADADHPNGWGTVLVVGMRFGGGPVTVDTAANGLGNPHAADDRLLRSAYVLFDITNPEAEPRLLAEIPVPDGSFSVGYPTVMTFKDRDPALDDNQWYLVFGSGPESLGTGASSTPAKLYLLDLNDLETIIAYNTGVADSFAGDPATVDWNLNYKADAVYFGLAGDAAADAGRLMRFAVHESPLPAAWTAPETLLDTSQPIVAVPTPGLDKQGNHWVYVGTGRLYGSADQASIATQSLYGVKDSGTGQLDRDFDLVDVTGIEVYTDGSIENGPPGISTFADLEAEIDLQGGWYLDLPPLSGEAGAAPATRSLNQQALSGGILFSSVYQPSIDACTGEGFSRLYGLYYKTGTPFAGSMVFGTTPAGDRQQARGFVDLGRGFATSPALHSGQEGEVSVFTQLSTGAIIRQEAGTVDKVRSGKVSWREVE